MTTTAIAIVLRPLILLVVVGLVLLPARRAVQRMPDGRLKRLLLFRLSSAYDAGDSRNGKVSRDVSGASYPFGEQSLSSLPLKRPGVPRVH